MKILHVVGTSNTGKTTFIRELIPALKRLGTVGVIKHLGDHTYDLEPGKDTTFFFEAGADISVGIDNSKAVATLRTSSLGEILLLLFRQGVGFAVIEGFKQEPYPKIVFGRITVADCVLSNPTVEEVTASLHLFYDYTP